VATSQPEIEAALGAAEDAKKNALEEIKRLFDQLDHAAIWRRHFYGGFDNYEDYVKYGDAFEEVVPAGLVRRRAPGSR